MMNKKPLGLLGPDKPDIRDLQYEEYRPKMRTEKLPESFPEMLQWETRIMSQAYGDCTSMGSTAARDNKETQQLQEIKEGNWRGSNRFQYHNTKRVSGNWNIEGDYSRNAAKALEKWGICPYDEYPYFPKDDWKKYVQETPPQRLYEVAKYFDIDSYANVPGNIRSFQNAIYREATALPTTMEWFSSYYRTPDNGILPEPEGESGWHLTATITWVFNEDLGEKMFVVKNSHGTDFGDNGYFYIPFNQWDKHNIRQGWAYTDIDNSHVKNMFKLRRDPEHQREIFAVKNGGRFHIANLYTLWRGSEQNKKTKYALWRWQKGADVPVADMNEWDKLEEGDEIALMPNDGEVEMEAREERKFTPKGFKDGNFIIEIDPDDPPSSFSSLF